MFGSWLVECLGKIRKCGFLGGVVSLSADSEVSKAHTKPSLSLCFLLVNQDVSCRLLLQPHAYLLASLLPAMVVMNSPLKL